MKPRPARTLLAHADWSVNARGRRLLLALPEGACGYRLVGPEPIPDPASLPKRLLARAPGNGAGRGAVLLGLDLPLGLPLAYARGAGIEAFAPWLDRLEPDDPFFQPARQEEEISLERPFYPAGRAARGKQKIEHLVRRLGLAGAEELYRLCDRATAQRRAASPLFWTLGAQQVGKAALAAWRDLVIPARRSGRTRLWPFEGDLAELVAGGGLVLAETYPAEAYRQIGLDFRPRGAPQRAKTRQADRAALAPALMAAARALGAAPEPDLEALIREGFPGDRGGDSFDALAGLLGLLSVTRGAREEGIPEDPEIRAIEGWIVGQPAG